MKTVFVLYCLLHATWRVGAYITAEGFETGEVTFKCSHRFAQTNKKYLCENSCDSKDVLLTVKPGGRVESERITLEDWGDGAFNVTFSRLRLTDSGTYWCGVERAGVDTYTEVRLIVKEGIVSVTAPVTPEPFPTWTYQNTSNVTQQTPGVETSWPTNIWPTSASNYTNGREQNNSTGTILYVTVGAVVVFTIILVAVWFRKCRDSSKPQLQVCNKSTDVVSSSKTEDPPTAEPTTAKCSNPLHIYENISFENAAHSTHSAANCGEKHGDSSGDYIILLPFPDYENADDGCLDRNTNKTMATRNETRKPVKESRESKASACDSSETRPRSLWFGLDLSGTI